MKFSYVKLLSSVQSPNVERPNGVFTSSDQYRASDGFEIEAVGELLLIRGKYGVQATALSNLADGRVMAEAEQATGLDVLGNRAPDIDASRMRGMPAAPSAKRGER